MKRLDQRGVAAFEFTLIAVPLFTLMFVIFDLARYVITVQSLHALANAEARAVMVNCYTPKKIKSETPSGCTADYLSATDKQGAAPFLYAGGLTPTVAIAATAGGSPLTITATQSGFRMLVPVWGTALDAPSATTSIPF